RRQPGRGGGAHRRPAQAGPVRRPVRRLSMLRPLLLFGALLGLAACATVETPAAPVETPPAPVAGYDWIPHVDVEGASLAYGVAESDDVPLMLACAPGRGRIEITRPADAARPSLSLSAGRATLTLAVRSEPSQLHD